MRPYSPGGSLNALTAAQQGSIPATPSEQRLLRGLPGYLILFATHAFAPQRQYWSRKSPSPPVFLLISTNFTSTPGIPLPSPILKPDSIKCTSGVKPRAFTSDLPGRLRALYAQWFRITLAPPVLRGCWHGVSRCFLQWYRQCNMILAYCRFFPLDRALRPESLHHSRGVAASGFPPLRKIPHCCLP